MWDQLNESGRHQAVPLWIPPAPVAQSFDPQLRATLAAWLKPRGGTLLEHEEHVRQWFRSQWYGPQPPAPFQLRDAFAATVRVDSYAALITANAGHRAVYLAAWLPDGSISPSTVARYESLFSSAGFRVTIDDGGLVAESEYPGHDPHADIGTALQVAQWLGALAQELSGVSNLPGM